MHNIFSEPLYLWREFKNSKSDGMSMRLRLLSFLFFFILAIMVGFFLILLLTGTFSSRENSIKIWMENELSHIDRQIYRDFGKISIQGLALSELLSQNIEQYLKDKQVTINQLNDNPDLLEPLLDDQTRNLIQSLSVTKSSGVFLILDATVNSKLENANPSRAGVFLKNSAPNIINSIDPSIRYLRGPHKVARNHSIDLLPQWQMEFDITKETFFDITLHNATNSNLPVSRLYYWSPKITLDNNSESGMLLCVPLVGSDGTVYGICGYEMSSMLFKLSYNLENESFSRAFAILTPIHLDRINSDISLFTGNYYASNFEFDTDIFYHNMEPDYFNCKSKDGTTYLGINKSVLLYPSDSKYSNDKWKLAIMMPSKDYKSAKSRNYHLYIYSLSFLFIRSLLAVYYISKKYISPVVDALNQLKDGNYSSITKTKILEIDDLLEFLSEQDDKKKSDINQLVEQISIEPLDGVLPDLSAYHEFVTNIQTLSPAERAVFNLYMQGHTAKEITKILCLSINTIKTHNKRIYMKLNVSSRNELMVYVNMMKKEEGNI